MYFNNIFLYYYYTDDKIAESYMLCMVIVGHPDTKHLLFILITSLMTLWNYTGNLFAFGPHTMELITNKNDEITAYRILSSPTFKYGSFVTVDCNQLVQC